MRTTSPGTSSLASISRHVPSRSARAHGELFPQRLDGVAGGELLPEADPGIERQQRQDDPEIRPVPDQGGEDGGDLDHPRDGAPEIAEEFQPWTGFLFYQLVRPVLGQPFLRLGLA